MTHKTLSPHSANTDSDSPASMEEVVRVRAYQLFEQRGGEQGHDLEDWFKAEAELLGKRPVELVKERKMTTVAAVA